MLAVCTEGEGHVVRGECIHQKRVSPREGKAGKEVLVSMGNRPGQEKGGRNRS